MSFTESEVSAARKRQAIFGGKVEDYLGERKVLSPLANIVKTVPLKGNPLGVTDPVNVVVAQKPWEQVIMDESGCAVGHVPAAVPQHVAVDRSFGDHPATEPLKTMGDFVTKDSGQRAKFETGAVRDCSDGKGRFDLITPIGLKRLAQLYERGIKKYGARNWEKGIPLWRFLDSAERHINDFKTGDRSEDHLAAVAWNALGYIHTEEMIRQGKLPPSLATEKNPNET